MAAAKAAVKVPASQRGRVPNGMIVVPVARLATTAALAVRLAAVVDPASRTVRVLKATAAARADPMVAAEEAEDIVLALKATTAAPVARMVMIEARAGRMAVVAEDFASRTVRVLKGMTAVRADRLAAAATRSHTALAGRVMIAVPADRTVVAVEDSENRMDRVPNGMTVVRGAPVATIEVPDARIVIVEAHDVRMAVVAGTALARKVTIVVPGVRIVTIEAPANRMAVAAATRSRTVLAVRVMIADPADPTVEEADIVRVLKAIIVARGVRMAVAAGTDRARKATIVVPGVRIVIIVARGVRMAAAEEPKNHTALAGMGMVAASGSPAALAAGLPPPASPMAMVPGLFGAKRNLPMGRLRRKPIDPP